jgi:hypothetical protein
MSSQKHPWQISSGPRRLEPRWSADTPGNAHREDTGSGRKKHLTSAARDAILRLDV